jgi:hypothetical protein
MVPPILPAPMTAIFIGRLSHKRNFARNYSAVRNRPGDSARQRHPTRKEEPGLGLRRPTLASLGARGKPK